MNVALLSMRFATVALSLGLVCQGPACAAEPDPALCKQDAMIVFDASGSMAGVVGGGIATFVTRIDEVRSALAAVLPSATRFRRVGLITYGAGPYNQCNIHLDLRPTANAAAAIMGVVNGLTPDGKTPLTDAVAQAAEVLDYREKPGLIVVITDGEETCGGAPCALATQLHDAAEHQLPHQGLFLDGHQHPRHDVPPRAEQRPLCLGRFKAGPHRGAREDPRLPDDIAARPRPAVSPEGSPR